MSTSSAVDRIVEQHGVHRPVVEVVVPVHDEERTLERSIVTLRRYLDERFPFAASLTVADNASTDRTWEIAERLARRLPGVRAVHLPVKGRGAALRAAWSTSCAEVVTYMDVDLSTDLDALLPLVAPLLSGHSDVATGSRLATGAQVARGVKRELISRGYNGLVRAGVGRAASDVQCGFKALTVAAARRLLPVVVDNGWFFDTELLVAARSAGMRIFEVPVDWTDDPDSRVSILPTACADLRGLARIRGQQILRRAGVALAVLLLAAELGAGAALRWGDPVGATVAVAVLSAAAALAPTWRLAHTVVARDHSLRCDGARSVVRRLGPLPRRYPGPVRVGGGGEDPTPAAVPAGSVRRAGVVSR
jgi:hypothetical protein